MTKINYEVRNGFFGLVVLFIILMVTNLAISGCARDSHTTREEVTDGDGNTTVVKETVVVDDDNDFDDGGSILGSVFNVIGEVIAFPFRLIAGVFRSVF